MTAHTESGELALGGRLSPITRWGAVTLLVLAFVFADGPIWRHPFDVDMAAWGTYAPIPVLTALLIAWEGKLGWVAWLLNTMELTLLKFGITYAIAVTLWMVVEPPVHAPPPVAETHVAPRAPKAIPTPTPWPASERRDLAVRVVDASGAPVAGVDVWVSAGLADLVIAPPSTPVTLSLAGGAWTERQRFVHEHQALTLHSADGRLHSVRLHDGAHARVVPLLAGGAPHRVELPTAGETIDLSCALHPDEGRARIVVLAHPHHARTDGKGVATLPAVPALPLTVTAGTSALRGETKVAKREGRATISFPAAR